MPGLDLLDIEGQWVGFRAPRQSGIEGGIEGECAAVMGYWG